MIVASAIQFYLNDNPNYPIIMTGLRHADIFEKMFSLHLDYNRTTATQGFLTDDNKFYDRYQAKEIALKCNQLIENTNLSELYSEDMWPE